MSLNSSLKSAQYLRGCKFTENDPKIYETGVYPLPMKIRIDSNGKLFRQK
jgi:hypothetical protein